VPGGLFHRLVSPSYQTPREKKPSSARTRITIRMIQRMLTVSLLLASVGPPVSHGDNGGPGRPVTGQLTVIAEHETALWLPARSLAWTQYLSLPFSVFGTGHLT
jgi:hypothetical protein